mgnify:CR=1 FL=1
MSKSYDAQGVVHSIGDTTEYGNNGFTKREFVLQLTGPDENTNYPNYIALELIKDKCALMDNYKIGDELQVSFNLSGRLWSSGGKPEKCFTSLQAWRIESADSGFGGQGPADGFDQTPNQGGNQFQPSSNSFDANNFDDDVPF